jgi:hypothetical protein
VGVGLLPAPVRNPAIAAMEFATLSRMHPGRFEATLGHGGGGVDGADRRAAGSASGGARRDCHGDPRAPRRRDGDRERDPRPAHRGLVGAGAWGCFPGADRHDRPEGARCRRATCGWNPVARRVRPRVRRMGPGSDVGHFRSQVCRVQLVQHRRRPGSGSAPIDAGDRPYWLEGDLFPHPRRAAGVAAPPPPGDPARLALTDAVGICGDC